MTGADPVGELLAAGDRHGPAAAAVLSFAEQDSAVGLYEAGSGLRPHIGFLALPGTGAALLAELGGLDDGAARLLVNYERAFPGATARLEALECGLPDPDAGTPVLGWLLAAAGVALDLVEDDLLLALSDRDGAVRVDTTVVEVDGRQLVDGRRLLRCLLSYRVAGAPGHVLIRSVLDSLATFVADALRRVVRTEPVQAVVCAGDLFAGNVILRQRVAQGLLGVRLPVLLPDPAATGTAGTAGAAH